MIDGSHLDEPTPTPKAEPSGPIACTVNICDEIKIEVNDNIRFMMNETISTILSCKPVHIHLETAFSTRMQSKFIPEFREERRAILQTMEMLSTPKKNENTTKRKMTN